MAAMETEFGPVEYTPESSPYDDMEAMERETNALERMGSLPLIAGTWGFVSSYYASAKKTYPSVSPYLELAERITAGAANAALTTTKPVVDKFAPTVNVYANRGLDKLENALPMIHDEPDEIYGSAKAAVASAVNRRIDSALSVTEKYVEYYLPPSKEEMEPEDSDDDDEDDSDDDDSDTSSTAATEMEEPVSPKERLQVISSKVRRRAYHRAMDKIRGVQKRSVETLGKLQFTVDLIQYAKQNMDSTSEGISSKVSAANDTIKQSIASSQENLATVWKEIKSRSSDVAAELRLLERARSLSGRIQESCTTLLAVVTKIPQNEFLVKKIAQVKDYADKLVNDLAGKTSLRELSFSLIETARTNLEHVRNLVEAMFELLVEHAPISWLAPEFDCNPLEGLFMQDLEAELHLHGNNRGENDAYLESQNGRVRFRRG